MSLLERALAKFDATAFAKRHGGWKESRSTRSCEYLLPCPHCGSERLRWNHPDKGAWICWGCRESGDTLGLIKLLEQVDDLGAIDFLHDAYNGGDAITQLAETASMERNRAMSPTRLLPQRPWPVGVEWLDYANPKHARAASYLHSRGVSAAMAREWMLAVGTLGWICDYVIFPVFMDGGLVYWQGRASWDPPNLDKAARKAWVKANRYRKTLNPKNEGELATAEEILFNFDRARHAPHVIVCEGPIDALKVGPNAVALFGKAASPQKVARLLRMPASRYTVYLDRGVEERQAADRLAAQLSDYAPTYIATPPDGYDPGALTPEQNAIVVSQAVPFREIGLQSQLKNDLSQRK